jgi:uncharacterized protein YbjQ (UPF0145 family)
MIVTPTNSIEGREISRYNNPIPVNVVIGITVFGDIGASYVEFFGGRATSYEKKMQNMYMIRQIIERILPFGSAIVKVECMCDITI